MSHILNYGYDLWIHESDTGFTIAQEALK